MDDQELIHAIATLKRIRERYEQTKTDYDKKLIPLWELRVAKLKAERQQATV